MSVFNAWLGRRDFSFWQYFLLSIVTCGIFGIYYEYKMGRAIVEIQKRNGLRVNFDLPTISHILAIFQLQIISVAIQQSEIHKFYSETANI